jgi:serine/threonine protein phosphatase PrpC
MGGEGDEDSGGIAGDCMALALLQGWAQGRRVEDSQRLASAAIAEQTNPKGGACFNNISIVATPMGNETICTLSFAQAGDCRTALYRNGQMVFCTEDENVGLVLAKHYLEEAAKAAARGDTAAAAENQANAEAASRVYKNVVSNAVTGEKVGHTKTYPNEIAGKGSTLLGATDGVWGLLPEPAALAAQLEGLSADEVAEFIRAGVEHEIATRGLTHHDNWSFVVVVFI